ncbi:hypothetical protein [Nakamurella lactea]|uniref:hypothetical protein n=1 Tax=Nakamurella lactea TaxID=459515 RepID=UPI0012B612C9|nr:hypothetical protein [Nakamurella lactea]
MGGVDGAKLLAPATNSTMIDGLLRQAKASGTPIDGRSRDKTEAGGDVAATVVFGQSMFAGPTDVHSGSPVALPEMRPPHQ